jgi:hypothetical protein
LRGQYGEGPYARQELGGEFCNVEGAEWPPEYFPASLWFSEFPPDPVLSVLACDPSLGKGAKKQGCFACIVYGAWTAAASRGARRG